MLNKGIELYQDFSQDLTVHDVWILKDFDSENRKKIKIEDVDKLSRIQLMGKVADALKEIQVDHA